MTSGSSKGSFSALLLHLHPSTIPESSAGVPFTWCLGGLAVLMFLIETLTGILLLLHYIPTAGGAYASMQDITHVVPYGFFLRNIHYWAGQIMIGLVGLHMLRVFWTGSFAPPRQFNWIIGLMLLVGGAAGGFHRISAGVGWSFIMGMDYCQEPLRDHSGHWSGHRVSAFRP